jgi:hypothetical protein
MLTPNRRLHLGTMRCWCRVAVIATGNNTHAAMLGTCYSSRTMPPTKRRKSSNSFPFRKELKIGGFIDKPPKRRASKHSPLPLHFVENKGASRLKGPVRQRTCPPHTSLTHPAGTTPLPALPSTSHHPSPWSGEIRTIFSPSCMAVSPSPLGSYV